MKIAPLIVVVWLCAFMAQPVITYAVFSTQQDSKCKVHERACCVNKFHHSKGPAQKSPCGSCPTGTCNPFISCSCFLYTAAEPGISLSSVKQDLMIYRPGKIMNLRLGYHTDCWHPPKMA